MAAVVITEFMDENGVETLRSRYDTLYDPDLWEDRGRLEAELGTARAVVVRNKTDVDAELIAAAAALEIVGRLGVGLDNIDTEAARASGVQVAPATGANASAVVEYVLGAAMALRRGVLWATPDVAAGTWPREQLAGRELAGTVMGLVGMGSIGGVVGERAAALGMEVIGFDPFLPSDSPAWGRVNQVNGLDTLLAAADVVSLHIPLTDETKGLIDSKALASMKSDAILINTARGGIVDELALVAALKDGAIGGAALDVFETEPLDAAAGAAFAGVPNLILTPHVAGVTEESNAAVSAMIANKVIEVLG